MNKSLQAFKQALATDANLRAQFRELCALQDVPEMRARIVALALEAGIDLRTVAFAPVRA